MLKASGVFLNWNLMFCRGEMIKKIKCERPPSFRDFAHIGCYLENS